MINEKDLMIKIEYLLLENDSIDIIAFDDDENQTLDITIHNIAELENNKTFNAFIQNHRVNGFFTRCDYKVSLEIETY